MIDLDALSPADSPDALASADDSDELAIYDAATDALQHMDGELELTSVHTAEGKGLHIKLGRQAAVLMGEQVKQLVGFIEQEFGRG